FVAIEAETLEQLGQGLGTGGVYEAEEEMLDGDVLVLELARLLFGAREDLIHGLSDVDLGGIDGAGNLGKALELAFDGELKRAGLEVQLLDEARDDPALLTEQGAEKMPGIHFAMLKTARDVLRVGDSLARHDGEFGEIHRIRFHCRPRAKLWQKALTR